MKARIAAFGWLATLVCAFIAAGASAVSAQWQVLPDGAGAGQSITLRGQLDGNALFQIWCRGSDQHIALLRPDGAAGALSSRGDDILFQIVIDGVPVWSGPGDPYRHSDGWAGLRYRMIQQARGIAESIVQATSTVAVMVTDSATGQRNTFTGSAEGSRAAVEEFLAGCFGAAPLPPSTAEQPHSTDTSSSPEAVSPSDAPVRQAGWQIREDASGATLLGFLDAENMLTLTCTRDATLRVITRDGRNEPPREDLLMSVSLSIDGREKLPAVAARLVRLSPGFLAFEAKLGGNSWAELLVAMLESRQSLQAEVIDTQSGQTIDWTVSNAGLPNAALEQHAKCLVLLFQ